MWRATFLSGLAIGATFLVSDPSSRRPAEPSPLGEGACRVESRPGTCSHHRAARSADVGGVDETAQVEGLDALHYTVAAEVGPTAMEYRGWTEITLGVLEDGIEAAVLNFGALSVDSVRVDGAPASFRHTGERLVVDLRSGAVGDTATVRVYYHGAPADGLMFGRSAYGQPTVFADNWPDRAHHWFPCIDRPGDKATVEFRVRAPAGWEVVANGRRVEGDATDAGGPATPGPEAGVSGGGPAKRLNVWATDHPIPVYTMVIGASELAVEEVGDPLCDLSAPGCVPVSLWAFPRDRNAAARLFRRAPRMVALFDSLIGPFPYEKLALVQSTTRYGGMENASAIFFSEPTVRRGGSDVIVAHEIAHQWFGDSVTEAEWPHLWLSEGFATYFASVFYELEVGPDSAAELLREAEASYLRSRADVASPVLDERPADLMRLLNRNNYQKGAWVLHMLRRLLGDEVFFSGIREYYRANAHGTALSADLRRVMEAASGRDLGWFFDQWLRRPGYPEVRVRHAWDEVRRALVLEVEQVQAGEAFRLPLEVEVELEVEGETRRRRESFGVEGWRERFEWPLPGPPARVLADPRNSLLGPVETLADTNDGADR